MCGEIPKELVDNYFASVSKKCNDFEFYLNDNDFENIELLAHRLSGSGSSYGFPEISSSGAKIEKAAPLKDAHTIMEEINKLKSILNSHK